MPSHHKKPLPLFVALLPTIVLAILLFLVINRFLILGADVVDFDIRRGLRFVWLFILLPFLFVIFYVWPQAHKRKQPDVTERIEFGLMTLLFLFVSVVWSVGFLGERHEILAKFAANEVQHAQGVVKVLSIDRMFKRSA